MEERQKSYCIFPLQDLSFIYLFFIFFPSPSPLCSMSNITGDGGGSFSSETHHQEQQQVGNFHGGSTAPPPAKKKRNLPGTPGI